MQIKHNLLNKNTTANRVSSRGNPVNLSLQPSLHLCKAPFGDRTNKNSIVNRGSPICVRKRNPADCHHLFVWFCLWDSEFGFIIWFSRGSFGQPCDVKFDRKAMLMFVFCKVFFNKLSKNTFVIARHPGENGVTQSSWRSAHGIWSRRKPHAEELGNYLGLAASIVGVHLMGCTRHDSWYNTTTTCIVLM